MKDVQEKTDYAAFYRRMTGELAGKDSAIRVLNRVNLVLTVIVYAAYAVILLERMLFGGRMSGAEGALSCVLPYILIPGISFVLVSFVRDRIDEKRPYESWDIRPLIPKNTRGHSMPSRHIFCTTIIAMCVLSRNAALGVVFLILSAFFACVRVIGGVHYPRDVIAGYIVGLLSGLLLFL